MLCTLTVYHYPLKKKAITAYADMIIKAIVAYPDMIIKAIAAYADTIIIFGKLLFRIAFCDKRNPEEDILYQFLYVAERI